jgi:hypothetical protein
LKIKQLRSIITTQFSSKNRIFVLEKKLVNY